MSRIVIERHENGEEGLTVGWDRPLGTGFCDRYDHEGECLVTYGPIAGMRLSVGATLARLRETAPWLSEETLQRVTDLLREHSTLDYPVSNVEVDLTKEA